MFCIKVIGVAQIINKKAGQQYFTEQDEKVIIFYLLFLCDVL